MKHRSTSPNVTKNLEMSGFHLIIYGRFCVITEVPTTGASFTMFAVMNQNGNGVCAASLDLGINTGINKIQISRGVIRVDGVVQDPNVPFSEGPTLHKVVRYTVEAGRFVKVR
jgi:hypothetical protein